MKKITKQLANAPLKVVVPGYLRGPGSHVQDLHTRQLHWYPGSCSTSANSGNTANTSRNCFCSYRLKYVQQVIPSQQVTASRKMQNKSSRLQQCLFCNSLALPHTGSYRLWPGDQQLLKKHQFHPLRTCEHSLRVETPTSPSWSGQCGCQKHRSLSLSPPASCGPSLPQPLHLHRDGKAVVQKTTAINQRDSFSVRSGNQTHFLCGQKTGRTTPFRTTFKRSSTDMLSAVLSSMLSNTRLI